MAHDPTVEAMLDNKPLLMFSLYTQDQADALRELGDEILRLLALNQAKDGTAQNDGPRFIRANNLFWFWVLGAYEVLRTMAGHSACFTPPVATDITALKQKLAKIRVPFAKQELRNNKGP